MLFLALFDNVLTSLCQVYSHLAQWTLELLFQPEVDALRMELVRTWESLHHLARLQIIKTNSARAVLASFYLRFGRG